MADVCKDNACEIKPLSAFLSTNLNNKIEEFDEVGERVKRSLGWPLISLEIHPDQLRSHTQVAVEYFTKYAGYTKEFLIFDSNLYERDKGIRLDHLFTLANTDLDTAARKIEGKNPWGPGAEYYADIPDTIFIATSSIDGSLFTGSVTLSAALENGVEKFNLVDNSLYNDIITHNPSLSSAFKQDTRSLLSLAGEKTEASTYQVAYDYDTLDYRKVVEVTDFEEGSSTGINTLFTLEQTLAQQTYFSYSMGNYGFDLVSWYTMKEWIDTREKVLSTKREVRFDPRTQYMKMTPQPTTNRFYGVISCYVEKPIRDVIKEQWVYEYTTALAMISIGMVRGKFSGVSLIGGGSLNYELLNEGQRRKEALETKLLEGASPGMGDSDPTMFIIG